MGANLPYLLLALLLFLPLPGLSAGPLPIRVFAHPEKKIGELTAVLDGKVVYLNMRQNDKQMDVLSSLSPEDEVLVTGHLVYEFVKQGELVRLDPSLVIDDLKPISLRKLGQATAYKVEDLIRPPLSHTPYAPIPMLSSDGVAATVLISTSVLLLRALTSISQDSPLKEKLNSMLIFSAAGLACGGQIYEDLTQP